MSSCGAASVFPAHHMPPKRSTLKNLVVDYQSRRVCRLSQELRDFQVKGQSSLPCAVGLAARGFVLGRKAKHQWRLRNSVLCRASNVLRRKSSSLAACTSFDQLFALVDSVRANMPGLGELWAYDTALRIGAALPSQLGPTRVFLQCGARVGATRLHGNWLARHRFVMPSCLRLELSTLSPAEAENFLCIYKDWLWHNMP
jgi:hypothetical protein